MKTVIAGSREFNDYSLVKSTLAELPWKITEVVSGGARGVDRLGERWAEENSIPVSTFIPDWNGKYGRGAGHVRNAEMAKYIQKHGGRAVIFWDGISPGTYNMINVTRNLKIITHIVMV